MVFIAAGISRLIMYHLVDWEGFRFSVQMRRKNREWVRIAIAEAQRAYPDDLILIRHRHSLKQPSPVPGQVFPLLLQSPLRRDFGTVLTVCKRSRPVQNRNYYIAACS